MKILKILIKSDNFFFIIIILSSCDNDIEINKNILNLFNKIKLFNFHIKSFSFLLNILKIFFETLSLLLFFQFFLNVINTLLILFSLSFLSIFYVLLFKISFNDEYFNNN